MKVVSLLFATGLRNFVTCFDRVLPLSNYCFSTNRSLDNLFILSSDLFYRLFYPVLMKCKMFPVYSDRWMAEFSSSSCIFPGRIEATKEESNGRQKNIVLSTKKTNRPPKEEKRWSVVNPRCTTFPLIKMKMTVTWSDSQQIKQFQYTRE